MTQFGTRVNEITTGGMPPDWETAAASGLTFAFAAVDEMYETHSLGIRAAGLILGAYIYPGVGINAFLDAVNDPTDMLIAIDSRFELDPTNADAFMLAWREHYPTHPVLQLGDAMYVSRTTRSSNGPLFLRGTMMKRLYPAPYGSALSTTYDALGGDGTYEWTKPFAGWAGPSIWEFSENVTVPGLPAAVPGLAFRGTLSSLRALTDDGPRNGVPIATL